MKCEVKNMKAGYGILADSFADSHMQLYDNKEAKASEVPKAFGTENERAYHILPLPVRWML